MFGTLKPRSCGLGPDERRAHRTLYCGLCQSLGEHHGQLARPMVSFDAVFLAVIADGLAEDPAPPSQTRCPMVPVVHRATVDPDSVAMQFATHVSVLLADQLLADRAEEGRALGWARPLVAKPAAHAREALTALGVDLTALQGFERQQAEVERDPTVTPARAAAPTAAALARVFGTIAQLPTLPKSAQPELERLGDAVGRIIYCVDALEDLQKDLRKGAFNPCLHPLTRAVDPQRVALCTETLEEALDEAGRSVAALPWKRHRAIAANIVSGEQRRRARTAIERANTALVPVSWRARLTRPLLVAWLLWWIRPAFAEPKAKVPAPTPAPAPAPATLWEQIDALLDGCVQSCVDCMNSTLSCTSACTDCTQSCNDCLTDCTNGCNSCDTGCSNCSKSCTDCGDSCNGCGNGCDDCGNSCNDCDNCGKGCDNCGKGCNC